MNQQLIEYVLVDAPKIGFCKGCAKASWEGRFYDCADRKCSCPDESKVWSVVPAGFSEEQKEEANHA